MKKTWIILACVLLTAIVAAGCSSRSYILESELVDLARRYQELFAKHEFQEILPMLSGDQLTAMNNALPVLTATSASIETEMSEWEGKCDFINRDKTRSSVIATYVQKQTVKDVGTLTEQFSTVYEFTKIADGWKLYSVKTMNKEPAK